MRHKSLRTLARLVGQHLDNQRAELIALSEQIQRVETHIAFLEKRVEEEAKIPQQNPAYQQDFDAFRRYSLDRCVALATSKIELDRRFAELQEKVIALFKQKKAYELALQTIQEHAKRERAAFEQKLLDEIPSRMPESTFFLSETERS